jgi:hypothetical protein
MRALCMAAALLSAGSARFEEKENPILERAGKLVGEALEQTLSSLTCKVGEVRAADDLVGASVRIGAERRRVVAIASEAVDLERRLPDLLLMDEIGNLTLWRGSGASFELPDRTRATLLFARHRVTRQGELAVACAEAVNGVGKAVTLGSRALPDDPGCTFVWTIGQHGQWIPGCLTSYPCLGTCTLRHEEPGYFCACM